MTTTFYQYDQESGHEKKRIYVFFSWALDMINTVKPV